MSAAHKVSEPRPKRAGVAIRQMIYPEFGRRTGYLSRDEVLRDQPFGFACPSEAFCDLRSFSEGG